MAWLFKKISFGTSAPLLSRQDSKPKDEKKKVQAEDKTKSNSAKYMIGAAALACTAIAGIIGHKQGWFVKAAKKGKELVNDAAANVPDTVTSKPNAVKNSEELAGATCKKVSGVSKNELNTDYSDFSKIESDIVFERSGYSVKELKNGDGKIIKQFFENSDGKTVKVVDYDPQNDELFKTTAYRDDGKILFEVDYVKNIKTTFNPDGTIKSQEKISDNL